MSVIVEKQKPTSPGQRGYIKVKDTSLYKGKPYRRLIVPKKTTSGRNNEGKITIRHRGAGHKKNYRMIDWKRNKDGIKGIIQRIEYDPNRSANIALVLYMDGERRYIIASEGLKAGSVVMSGKSAPITNGNCLSLNDIPIGSVVHCVEMKPGKGAQLARSAGCSIQFLARENRYATLRLKSGEMRKILANCRAVIGEVGMSQHNLIKIGKAGRNRWKGKRPNVRGVAMNPVDHPLGGGEGRTSGGRPACTPWGKPEGKRTRDNKAKSKKLILRRRRTKSDKK